MFHTVGEMRVNYIFIKSLTVCQVELLCLVSKHFVNSAHLRNLVLFPGWKLVNDSGGRGGHTPKTSVSKPQRRKTEREERQVAVPLVLAGVWFCGFL